MGGQHERALHHPDPNSPECKQMMEQAAKMKDRETAARLTAMCK